MMISLDDLYALPALLYIDVFGTFCAWTDCDIREKGGRRAAVLAQTSSRMLRSCRALTSLELYGQLYSTDVVSAASLEKLYWILVCSFVAPLLVLQNWSSLLQETSSMPWRHPALTSCWEGKAWALFWAHSRSAQRPAPLSLESKPRGGDWSGLCFDTRFSSARRCPRWWIFLAVLTWKQGELSQTVNVAFSVQNKNLHMPFSHAPTKLAKHRVSLVFLSATP